MRPLQLQISAWGPYAQRESVNFENLELNSVFLITGPTGSGKTTIFDAISYALYGNVSGKYRDKNTVRSDFSNLETDTYVTLLFEHGGKRYEITRKPRYERAKKRGTGTILSPEQAQLRKDSNIIAAGISDVNEKIENLLGINYSQFKQITMIAQGEFMELLTASSADRSAIFRKLFLTDQYEKLAKQIQEQAKDMLIALKETKSKMKEAVDQIYSFDNQELTILKQRTEVQYEEVIRLLTQIISCKKTELGILEKKIYESDQLVKQVVGTMEQIKYMNSLKARREELKKSFHESQEQYSLWISKKEEMQQLQEEAEFLKTKELDISQCLPIYDQLGLVEEQIHTIATSINTAKAKELTLKEQDENLDELMEKRGKKIEAFLDIKQKETDHKHLIRQTKEKLTALKALWKKAEQLGKDEAELNELTASYLEITEKKKETAHILDQKEEAYQNAAVGLAARYLKEGMPCPVCGSTKHPHPAVVLDDTPDETEIRRWKETLKKIQKEHDQIFEKASVMSGKVKQEKMELARSSCELGLKLATDELIQREQIKKYYSDELARLESQQQEADQLEKKIIKLKEWEEEQEKNRSKKQKIQKDLADILAEYTDLKSKLDTLKGERNARKEQLTVDFPGQKEAKEGLAKCKEARKKLEEKVNGILLEQEKAKDKMEHSRIRLLQVEQELKEKVKNGHTESLEDLNHTLLELESNQKENQAKKEELAVGVKINESILAKLTREGEQYRKLEYEYGIVKDLDLVTKGNNPKRIIFEHYVLASYFEEILQLANQRFYRITEGRYELIKVERVADARTKEFLELDVMDHYTGKRRPVKTLSGGEAFKAALSLALGLSDMIQNHAGGVEITTIFIDEGFGGLDTESLEQALTILVGQAAGNRTVGIISHVEELKERIENQIRIEKSISGSHIRQ